MSKLGRTALGAVGFWVVLTFLHGWLNLGFDPTVALGLRKGDVTEGPRFRVGFLPVT